MPADIIQIQYERLVGVANQFARNAETTASVQQQVVRSSQALRHGGWEGRGATAFFAELDGIALPAVQRLTAALKEAQKVTLQIEATMRQAEEEAARPFRERGSGGVPSGQPGVVSTVETSATGAATVVPTEAGTVIDIAKKIVDAVDKIWDGVGIAAGALLASSLKLGTAYEGQVLVSAPKWLTDLGISGSWLKGQAGVSSSLSSIKADNIAAHIGKSANKIGALGALIAIGKGVVSVADVWHKRGEEYASYDASRRLSAVTVDTTLALVPVFTETIGTYLGAKAFASFGVAIGAENPIAAVALGITFGVAGAVMGGMAGEKVGDGIVNVVEQQIGREELIDVLDGKVVRPMANAISEAMKGLQMQAASPGLSTVRFGR